MKSTITHRPLCGEADAMRLHRLLTDSYSQLGRLFNWEIRRWEGSYWCSTDAELADPNWGAHTEIWETAGGDLVGAAVPDGPGDLALQIHPDYRDLEDEIIAWGEQHLARTNDDGTRALTLWAYDWDTDRQERLARLGYAPKPEWFWHQRRRPITLPVPDRAPAEGYLIRSVRADEHDVLRWIEISNTTFGHRHPPEMHRNFQRYSPSHNYDLHIVAEAPDGTFAAFAGMTLCTANRYGLFEPVGTHPDHRRKGLASACMNEAIRRVQALGGIDVLYVANWGTADAGKLYASVGLEHYATETAWQKTGF